MRHVDLNAMGKKRPSKRKRKPRRPGAPEDFAQLPFGAMARFGRFVDIRLALSPEQHRELLEARIDEATGLHDRQRRRRERIIEILREVDGIDLLGRACLTYLHFDPDTFKEWESDRSPAHVEYLALQALSVGLVARPSDPVKAMHLTLEALHVAREMFEDASTLLMIDALSAHRDCPNDPAIEYIFKTRMESLGVRGASYDEHLVRVLHGCLDPFHEECRRLLGFTVTDAITLGETIPRIVTDRVAPRWQKAAEAREKTLKALKRDRRRGRSDEFPDWLLRLSPTEAKVQVGLMAEAFLFADSRALTVVSVEELASTAGIDRRTVAACLEAFTCPPDEFDPRHHAFPGGAHPLTSRPILKCEQGYILPVPTSFMPAIRPRMEDLLRQHPKVWGRYVDARGAYVEREATALLATAFPGSESWTGIKWKSSAAQSDLDGLVGTDDVTLRVQCKAGRLTAPARRGAPDRMREELGELIEHAARQHQALRNALRTEGPESIGFTPEQRALLQASYQFDVIVCLDDVTVWATEAHKLRSIGVLLPGEPVPWVLSLTDLMAVVDLLNGAQLAHYLMRRQRLERVGRIEAHDELDWVGHYISEGLYFDQYFDVDNAPNVFRLLSYTEPIDAWYFSRAGVRSVEAPKPQQPIPPKLGAFLDRLAAERPEHWISASVAILDHGADGRSELERFIDHAVERVPQVGWSNASVVSDGNLGLTIYINLRSDRTALRRFLVEYCREKAEALRQPNWVAIGEGAGGGLFVIVLGRDPSRPLADVFQQPRAAPPKLRSIDGDQEEGSVTEAS